MSKKKHHDKCDCYCTDRWADAFQNVGITWAVVLGFVGFFPLLALGMRWTT